MRRFKGLLFWSLALIPLWGSAGAWAVDDPPVEAPSSTDPESIEKQKNENALHNILMCSQHLSRGIEAQGGHIDSRRLMGLRLTDPSMFDSLAWFQSLMSKTIKRALQVRINRSLVSERGLEPGEQYYIIQQLNLKDLNEHLLDIGGTQYYLQALDASLHSVLEENPEFGSVVHVNYKDRVVVSKLNPKDFESKVLNKIRERTLSFVQILSRETGEAVDWRAFLDRSLAVNHGDSIERALFNLRLELLGLSEEAWRKEILETRASVSFLVKSNDDIPDLLRKYRRVEKDPELLARWAAKTFSKGSETPALANLKRYLELLAVGDMLPAPPVVGKWKRRIIEGLKRVIDDDPKRAIEQFRFLPKLLPEAWSLHRSIFLRSSFDARIIISTDMRSLGARALEDRERWVAAGAKIEDLPNVYKRTTAFIEEQNQKFYNALRYIVGNADSIHSYVSGDDGLWSLPDLSPERLEELKTLLEKFSQDFYFHVEVVQSSADPIEARQNTANAVNIAWKALFESKNKKKAAEFSDILSELQMEVLENEGPKD